MIRQTLDKLSDGSREALRCAFEQGDTLIIKLNDSKFIGVNVVANTNLIILESAGLWAYGKIGVTNGTT